MLSTLSDWFYRWAKGWLIFVLLILDGFLAGYLFPLIQRMMQDEQGGVQPLDVMFLSTPERIFSMIERYGEHNRLFYRNVELTADILYPIVYTFFFGLLISWLFQRGFASDNPMRIYNIMPLGAWVFDLLENTVIVILLSVYPARPTALAWILVVLIAVKWLFAGASILLILIGIVVAIKNGFKLKE